MPHSRREDESLYFMAVNLTKARPAAGESSGIEHRVFLILACFALLYAFLAGFRTVSDLDTGWQLATGRWVVQHHQVPSADVLSYTAPGKHWIYPVGAGVVFYFAFLAGGYALLSWISAAACAGTIALLLRRGSAVSAAIAILAVPLIAERTPPRADMFTVVLFAAIVLAALILVAPPAWADEDQLDVTPAITAAQQWLGLIDAG